MLCFKLQACRNGNADPQEMLQDKLEITAPCKLNDNSEVIISYEEDEDQMYPSFEALSLFVENICVYIAGFVGKRLAKSLECRDCISALSMNDDESIRLREDYILLLQKDKGGLFRPSDNLICVCKIVEKVIRVEQVAGVFNLNGKKIEMLVKRECVGKSIFDNLHDHYSSSAFRRASFANQSAHKWYLISEIAKLYIKIRLHYVAKTSSLQAKPLTNRNKFTKLIHFTGN